MDSNRTFTSQFVINNLPNDQREYLMKKDVREEISEYAGVEIAIRGRYMKPKEDGSLTVDGGSRPLYLHITGSSKRSLTLAMKKIQTMMKLPTCDESEEEVKDLNLEEKITVGIDVFPSIFRMKCKILGENNENVSYISKETGAVISLRGKGSGFGSTEGKDEPLHILVKHKNVESRDQTRKLLLNLIETVQNDFIEAYGVYYTRPKKPEIIPIRHLPPSEMKKSSESVNNLGGETLTSSIEKITIGLDRIPPKFNLKSKIYGPNLSNVKHIEKVTNALLLVEGRGCSPDSENNASLEPPYILVKYLKPDMKERARNLILNLIETIQQEFLSLYGVYPTKPKKPEIFPLKSLLDNANPVSSSSVTSKFPKSATSTDEVKSSKRNFSPVRLKSPLPKEWSEHHDAHDTAPIPPPPPVISRLMSEEDIQFNRPSRCSKKSVSPTTTNYNRNLTSPACDTLSGPIKQIPSLAAPVDAPIMLPVPVQNPFLPAQRSINPAVPFTSSEVSSFPSHNPQYFKKRSNSPVEIPYECKKFCHPPNADTSSVGHIQSIYAQRDSPATGISKAKTSSNRYLVPVPKVDAATVQQGLATNNQPNFAKKNKFSFSFDNIKKINGLPQGGSFERVSDNDDTESVILVESDEELQPTEETSRSDFSKPGTRTVSVQTDVYLHRPHIKCACGRFTRGTMSVRSYGVQTIGELTRRF